MKQYVIDFSTHLSKALEIGNNLTFNSSKSFDNILISGLGGSGIGGTIVAQLIANEINVPITINKDYSIPAFVSEKTLFIACSYSGNTEETLFSIAAAEEKGAEIACITSGGKILAMAQEKKYNHIAIPDGFPPRAAIGYSLPQLFFLLERYGFISNSFIAQIEAGISLINENEETIIKEATAVADKLFNKIPVIYSDASFEGVGVRFRQQINENSKMLCWHHVIPEMNHNELVGWAGGSDEFSVVIFRNESDYYRSQKRMEINKEIIGKHTKNITEIYSKGDSAIEKTIYLIHLGDWVSVILAELKDIDPVEVNVISGLKNELSQL